MKVKDISRHLLIAQQREMNEHYQKYRELVSQGKSEEAAVYYEKTVLSANRLVDNGQKILSDILDRMDRNVQEKRARFSRQPGRTSAAYYVATDEETLN